jgi:hypothetical protein
MSEWLDVMLEELARKRREAEEARAEQARREQHPPLPAGDQPK